MAFSLSDLVDNLLAAYASHHNGTNATLNENQHKAIIAIGRAKETKGVAVELEALTEGAREIALPCHLRIHDRDTNQAMSLEKK